MSDYNIQKISDYLWEIPKQGGMRVPARLYANEKMLDDILSDDAPQQAANVAHMPGIVKASMAMPDIHWGYGFPIGGVAAFDTEDGVISPGGVGYDINCLAGGSRVLHEHGYTRSIAHMEATWQRDVLRCQDFEAPRDDTTAIQRYLKRRPQQPTYRVTTESGDEIVATADHPFWTPDGMVELDELDAGDCVAQHPFEGVPYEAPDGSVLVDAEDIQHVLNEQGKKDGNVLGQVVAYLKSRDLLPLRADASALPYLIKVLGYLFGDGTLYFSGASGKGTTWFYGKSDDLKAIREDIAAAGFTPSRIYRRTRDHTIQTTYDTYQFEREETAFKVASTSFAALMAALGAPVGAKATQDYRVPGWLHEAPRWHQRLFLAAFFGAELASPRAFTERNRNFQMPVLSINKKEGWVESGRRFLQDISALLDAFEVEAETISERAEQRNGDGTRSHRLRLMIASTPANLIALWGRVGYAYNRGRYAGAMTAVAYLKRKQQVLDRRREAAGEAAARHAAGYSPTSIYADLKDPHVNRRFLERSLYETRTSDVRCGAAFETFDAFSEWARDGLGTSGMVWTRIASIEPVDLEAETGDPYVYDFTVAHDDHNFVANGFVVSNCGVRLMTSDLEREQVQPQMESLVDELFRRVPTGVGSSGATHVSRQELKSVLQKGAQWAIEQGYGHREDLDYIEENGRIDGADPGAVSSRALERGTDQIGTLGSGNHFLEVGYVSEVYDDHLAERLGLQKNQVTAIIHSGSRGFGYQVCDDALSKMGKTMNKYGIDLPDRQLACAPIQSPEGEQYIRGMHCAINYAFANRQTMAHNTRLAFERVLGLSPRDINLKTVYEVAHNIAKFETHRINGDMQEVCVHRKGATRAFPAGHPEIPETYQDVGQPVLIPGDMGRYSYVLVGTDRAMDETFGSTCHGAGRQMSRRQARKIAGNRNITAELANRGIIVRGESGRTVREEISEAYKDVADVVEAVEGAGISRRVVQLRPLGCIKG